MDDVPYVTHPKAAFKAGCILTVLIDMQVLWALKSSSWRAIMFPFGGRGSDAVVALNAQAGWFRLSCMR